MPTVSVTEQINAPVSRVFELSADIEHSPEHISGIDSVEMLTDGPMGVGTRWRETRTMWGKQATEEMWITEFVPDDHYTAVAESMGMRYTSTFRFKPIDDGTEVTMEFVGTPLKFMAKLMFPLLGWMTKSVVLCVTQDLKDLKKVAEQTPETSTVPE